MLITVDWEDPRPVYVQLRDQIVEKVATGDLKAGAVLPSVRRLAEELGVNLHTVHKVYEALDRMGLVRLRPRVGAVIRSTPRSDPAAAATLRASLRPVLAAAWTRGLRRTEILEDVDDILAHFVEPVPDSPLSPTINQEGA